MAKKEKNWDNDNNLDNNYGTGNYIDNSLFDKLYYDENDLFDNNENFDDEDEENVIINPTEFYEKQEEINIEKKKQFKRKPNLIGKHSLVHDSIFKGKKTTIKKEQDSEHIIKNANGSLDINDSYINSNELLSESDYYRNLKLKNDIHKILKNNTDINFNANRRKPAKSDFNAYFLLLNKELFNNGYSFTEIFIELSGYFSDNTWNIFQLLEKKYANLIIKELREKYGISDLDKINFII